MDDQPGFAKRVGVDDVRWGYGRDKVPVRDEGDRHRQDGHDQKPPGKERDILGPSRGKFSAFHEWRLQNR
jgi:hypothetical protein